MTRYTIELDGLQLRRYMVPEAAWVQFWCAPADAETYRAELVTWPTRKGAEGWAKRHKSFALGSVAIVSVQPPHLARQSAGG